MCMLLHNQTSTKNFSAVLFSNQSIKELNNTKSNYTLQYITLHYITYGGGREHTFFRFTHFSLSITHFHCNNSTIFNRLSPNHQKYTLYLMKVCHRNDKNSMRKRFESSSFQYTLESLNNKLPA